MEDRKREEEKNGISTTSVSTYQQLQYDAQSIRSKRVYCVCCGYTCPLMRACDQRSKMKILITIRKVLLDVCCRCCRMGKRHCRSFRVDWWMKWIIAKCVIFPGCLPARCSKLRNFAIRVSSSAIWNQFNTCGYIEWSLYLLDSTPLSVNSIFN